MTFSSSIIFRSLAACAKAAAILCVLFCPCKHSHTSPWCCPSPPPIKARRIKTAWPRTKAQAQHVPMPSSSPQTQSKHAKMCNAEVLNNLDHLPCDCTNSATRDYKVLPPGSFLPCDNAENNLCSMSMKHKTDWEQYVGVLHVLRVRGPQALVYQGSMLGSCS